VVRALVDEPRMDRGTTALKGFEDEGGVRGKRRTD